MKLDSRNFEGKKLHLIDVSAVMMSYYKNKGLFEMSYTVDGVQIPTKALFGLFSLFKKLDLEDTFVFCFDSKNNIRKVELGEYKSGREKVGEDYIIQHSIAYEVINNCEFNTIKFDGYEADDFIVTYAKEMKSHYDNIFIHSNDRDLTSAVDENIHFMDIIQTRPDIAMDNYMEMLQCPYNTILLKKATVGDSSDKIKGITRFGQVAFDKFIANVGLDYDYSTIREKELEKEIIMKSPDLTESQKMEALHSLNIVIPRLPDGFEVIMPKESKNVGLLKWYLEKYGMKSVLKVLN